MSVELFYKFRYLSIHLFRDDLIPIIMYGKCARPITDIFLKGVSKVLHM